MHAPAKGSVHDPAWRAFAAWCRRLALRPLPAHPWTVGAFLRWCDEKPGAVAVADAVGVIASVHARRGYGRPERHLIVRRTLVALARRHGTDLGRLARNIPENATVLFRAEDFAVMSVKPRAQKSAAAPRPLSPAPKLVERRRYRVH